MLWTRSEDTGLHAGQEGSVREPYLQKERLHAFAGKQGRRYAKLRDMNVVVSASDERSIEVLASGLPLLEGDRCHLVVVALETGGRWSSEALELVESLACSFVFFHVLSRSFMFFHVLSCSSCSFMFFHVLSCSFMFFHVLSFSFIFFHFLCLCWVLKI